MQLGLLAVLFSFLIFNPSKVKQTPSIKVLPEQSIAFDFSTPALAAYEDSLNVNEEEFSPKREPSQSLNLKAGNLNKNFEVRINQIVKNYKHQSESQRSRVIVFKEKKRRAFNIVAYNTRYIDVKKTSNKIYRPKISYNNTPVDTKSEADKVMTKKKNTKSVSIVGTGPLPVYLLGQILISEKIKYSSQNHHIKIYRSFNKEIIETGDVDINKNSFSLKSSAWRGSLVVDVRDSTSGGLIGRGKVKIANLAINRKIDVVDNINVIVSPYKQGLLGWVSSTSGSLPLDTLVELVDLNKTEEISNNTEFHFKNIIESSKVISKTTAAGHVPTLQIIDSNKTNHIKIYHKTTVDSLIALSKDDLALKEEWSVIIGKITKKAEAVSGAKIEVISKDQKVIYFNGFIPDPSLTRTTANGEFAIISKLEGPLSLRYSVVEKAQEVFSPTQEIVVAIGHLSRIDFINRGEKELVVDVYDAKDKFLINNVEFHIAGKNKKEQYNEFNFLNLPKDNFDLFLKYTPSSNYMSLNFIIDSNAEHIKLPAVSKDVKDTIMGLQATEGTGSLLVLKIKEDEHFSLDENYSNENLKRVYFDKDAKLVKKEKAFFMYIYNIEPGLRSIIVTDNNSDKIYSKLIYIDSNIPILVQ